MAVSSTRNVSVAVTGDQYANNLLQAATNVVSPGGEGVPTVLGTNTVVAVPTGATAVSVQKPTGNLVQLTLKGVAGDTGLLLHLTDPDSISLAAGQTSLVISAASAVTVHLYWS